MWGISDSTSVVVGRLLKTGLSVSLIFVGLVAGACERPVGTLAAVEGVVEVRAASGVWRSVRAQHRFCPGDQLAVRGPGRAAVVLDNDVLVRLDAHSTLTLPTAKDAEIGVVLPEGLIHVISRFRKRVGVSTPLINAMVDGTEFVVAGGAHRARVTVSEGRVRVASPVEERRLVAGEAVEALPGGAIGPSLSVKPLNDVRWAIHYPQILRPTEKQLADLPVEQRRVVEKSIRLATAGQFRNALEAMDGVSSLVAFRASLLLGLGRVDQAEALLDTLNESAVERSVRAVIQAARNADSALHTAQSAVNADPDSAAAHLALSYAWQGKRQLSQSLAAAEQATHLAPDHPLAWARRAELELALARVTAGAESARHALALAPDTPRAQAMAAFARLLMGQVEAAIAEFEAALSLNGAEPLAHFGLGLAYVRQGDFVAGRREIEIAVLLDPSNAELRSYLGRSYLAEKRDQLAGEQFDLARRLDPASPTPWYFDAFRKQQSRDFLAAITDGEQAVAHNDQRAVLRSDELLDQDRAARAASLGDAYREVGWYGPMQTQAMDALEDDPQSVAAHRLLADAYTGVPRFETARLSELLQVQLRQPIGQMPLPPQFVMPALPVFDGPRSISPDEGSGFFVRQPWHFASSLLAGTQDTRAVSLVAAHAGEAAQISLGAFDYRRRALVDGQADTRLSGLRLNGLLALSAQTMLHAELRQSERQSSDLTTGLFDQNVRHLRDDVRSDLVRLALRHVPNAEEEMIVAFSRQWVADHSLQRKVDDPFPGVFVDSDYRPHVLTRDFTLLYSRQSVAGSLVVGLRHFKLTGNIDIGGSLCCLFGPDPFVFPENSLPTEISRRSLFGYGQWRVGNGVMLHGGAEYLRFEDRDSPSAERINGKIGVSFRSMIGTTLRAAVFQGVKGSKYDKESLEPTQFAGFNQSFDDFNGTRWTRSALAIDQRFGSNIHGGLELSQRRLDIPGLGCGTLDCLARWQERRHRAYLVLPFGSQIALSTEWHHENSRLIDGADNVAGLLPYRLRTDLLPLRLWVKTGPGDLLLETWGVRQRALFRDSPGLDISGRSAFAITNLRYSLPYSDKRWLASLSVSNLFDRQFRFQNGDYNGDPKAPLFHPRRSVLFQLVYRY